MKIKMQIKSTQIVNGMVATVLFFLVYTTGLAQKNMSTGLKQPVCTYINLALYDELSDTVRLTETLAMQQLAEMIRLKKEGVKLDYYMMDAFWFDKAGGYRKWRKGNWAKGPDAWLKACSANGIKPGLWVSTNVLHAGGKFILDVPDEWQSSVGADGHSLCLFSGNYLNHFMQTLGMYAEKGIKMFKFDFFDVDAVTPSLKEKMTKEEIKIANTNTLQNALISFRKKYPEVILIGYNGFGGDMDNTGKAITKNVSTSWLNAFHTMYCGDPRPADVPAINFWRSKDIYSDHMVRYFQANDFPFNRIDNPGFMIGKTGTCYYRGTAAWKGMLLLSLARGGWMNTYYGNLDLLNKTDAKWFAKAQQMYLPMQTDNTTKTFGGIPGKNEIYGYASKNNKASVTTIVNPSQEIKTFILPASTFKQGKILFSDSGFIPSLINQEITLGPEQLVVIGYGDYAKGEFNLGKGNDVFIPRSILPIPVSFSQNANVFTGSFLPSTKQNMRIIFQQFDDNEIPFRSSGGAPPDGITMEKILSISVIQNEKKIPQRIQYNKAIWSGLSWAAVEFDKKDIEVGKPITIEFATSEKQPLHFKGQVYSTN